MSIVQCIWEDGRMVLGNICHLLLQWSCVNLLTDRYFHLTKITGISYKSKHGVEYPSLSSSVRPVLHSQDVPGPKPPQKWTTDDKKMIMGQSIWNRKSAIQTFNLLHKTSRILSPNVSSSLQANWAYLRVEQNSWGDDYKAATFCRRILIFVSLVIVGKILLSILL